MIFEMFFLRKLNGRKKNTVEIETCTRVYRLIVTFSLVKFRDEILPLTNGLNVLSVSIDVNTATIMYRNTKKYSTQLEMHSVAGQRIRVRCISLFFFEKAFSNIFSVSLSSAFRSICLIQLL